MAMEKEAFEELAIRLKERMRAGDNEATRHLGDLYYQGLSGNAKNTSAALPYWQRAADNGDKEAALKVGVAYRNGWGCVKDPYQAVRYLKISADRGDKNAQFYVACHYEEGIGCEKNAILAKRYYEKAALQGHGKAQSSFAMMLYEEKHNDWIHWICCAHLSGIQEATDYLNYMIKKDFPKDAIEWKIEEIKKYGVDPKNHPSSNSSSSSSSGGCYIATCVYGYYDCPQVWTLRRFRDNTLASTWYGRAFIRAYYAISPTLVKWFGHTEWFKNMWKGKLDRMVANLNAEGVEDTPYEDRNW